MVKWFVLWVYLCRVYAQGGLFSTSESKLRYFLYIVLEVGSVTAICFTCFLVRCFV
ncbi:hypothetical protein CCACVL1_12852, partial [Corchorus capsularis]